MNPTKPRPALDHLEHVGVASRAGWRAWLERNHGQAASVWVITWKKREGAPYVPYGDIRDEALCFGWIDSLPRKLDDARTMTLLSPRRKGSGWSAVNKARIEALTAEGRMTPTGVAKIEAARADGSWTALDAGETLEVPDDLAAALKASPGAETGFEALNRSTRRGLLEKIHSARRPETRARRIEVTVATACQTTQERKL